MKRCPECKSEKIQEQTMTTDISKISYCRCLSCGKRWNTAWPRADMFKRKREEIMKIIDKPLSKVVDNFFDVDYSEIELAMIVVTKSPRDFPDKFVARLFDIYRGESLPTTIVMIKDTIEEIQQAIPGNFHKHLPSENDDPIILEFYVDISNKKIGGKAE